LQCTFTSNGKNAKQTHRTKRDRFCTTLLLGCLCGSELNPNPIDYAPLFSAVVFHWPPSEIDGLSLEDIVLFREQARDRMQEEAAG
jgi:hypothetical protein